MNDQKLKRKMGDLNRFGVLHTQRYDFLRDERDKEVGELIFPSSYSISNYNHQDFLHIKAPKKKEEEEEKKPLITITKPTHVQKEEEKNQLEDEQLPTTRNLTSQTYNILYIGAVVLVSLIATRYIILSSPETIDNLQQVAATSIFNDNSHNLKIYAPKHEPPTLNDIPIFLDIGRTSAISYSLTDCITPKNKDRKSFNKKTLEKVIHTNSLCEVPKYLEEGQRARLFVLVRKPFVQAEMIFKAKKQLSHPHFDERVIGVGFSTYMNSPLLESNPLTRAILCKRSSKVTIEDYSAAKDFLEQHANLEFFKDRKKLIFSFLKTFDLKSNIDVKKCISEKIGYIRRGGKNGYVYDKNTTVEEINKYDSMLYKHLLENPAKLT